VLDAERALALVLEPGVGEHDLVRPRRPVLLVARRNPARRPPPLQDGIQRLLPRLVAHPRRAAPHQGQVPAGLEPAIEQAGRLVTVEAMKRVADDHQVERLGRQR
jgi:hypothetical protein